MVQDSPSRKQDQFIVRLPDGMRDRIKVAADLNNRSMNAEIVASLEERFPALIGATAYIKANEDGVSRNGFPISDIEKHSSELLVRPAVGAGTVIDPRGIVRTSDGVLFMEVICLP